MAIKSPMPGNDGEFSTDTAQAILAAIKSAVPQEHWPLIVCDVNPIAAARKILSEAFRDQSFLDVYVANIAKFCLETKRGIPYHQQDTISLDD